MAARLRRTVVLDGVRYPEGTQETEQLRAAIPNPGAWAGDTAYEVPTSTEVGVSVTSPTAEEMAASFREALDSVKAELKAELLEELTDELRELIDQIPTAVLHDGTSDTSGQDDGRSDEEVPEPPRGGAGATEPAWREYAEQLGVDVTGVADRSGIIAAVDQHKAAQR